MEINIKHNLKIEELLSNMQLNELLKLAKDVEKELIDRKCTPIEKLKVGVRARHIYEAHDITYIEQFNTITYRDLIKTRKVGKNIVNELIKELSNYGISIKYCEKCKGLGEIYNFHTHHNDKCPNCA